LWEVLGSIVFEEDGILDVGVQVLEGLQQGGGVDLDATFEAKDVGGNEVDMKGVSHG
jgi:hypothetical protein